MFAQVGVKRLTAKKRKTWHEEIYQQLKTGKVYQLDPNKKLTPPPWHKV